MTKPKPIRAIKMATMNPKMESTNFHPVMLTMKSPTHMPTVEITSEKRCFESPSSAAEPLFLASRVSEKGFDFVVEGLATAQHGDLHRLATVLLQFF